MYFTFYIYCFSYYKLTRFEKYAFSFYSALVGVFQHSLEFENDSLLVGIL